MTFLTFVGGLVVFGLAWLFVPRASFMATLTMLLMKCYEVKLFVPKPATSNAWEDMTTILIIAGIGIGLILDAAERRYTLKHWDT